MKILKFLCSISFALILSVIGAAIFSPVIEVKPLYIASFLFAINFIPGPQGVLYGLIGTAPGGIGTAFLFNLPYLPEILHWNDAAAPINALNVTTDKEGNIFNLAAAGLAAINGYMKKGPQAANDVTVQLASGHLNRNVTINGTTSAVGAINFYAHSDNHATAESPVVPFKTSAVTAIALTETTFENFMALFIPTMATLTDYADVEFTDGHVQRMEIQDLITMSTNWQEIAAIIINNIDSYIHRVKLRCVANTPVYSIKAYIKGQ